MRTYGTLTRQIATSAGGSALGWSIDAEPHVLMRLRRIFPRCREQAGAIVIADTPETCVELEWCLDRWPLELTDQVRARLAERAAGERTRVATYEQVIAGLIPARPIATAEPLREYQRLAVELTLQARGLLVGDELGTGKTWVGIGLVALARPAVVVTETHLTLQWERELRRVLPSARPHVIKRGTPYDVTRRGVHPWRWPENDLDRVTWPDVFVMSYSKLAGWADTLSKLGIQSVVFDEAQQLRTGLSTSKGSSARVLAAEAVYRLMLTATPVYNYGAEIYNLVNILRPGELGTREEFGREWCSYEDRVADPAALGTYLRRAGIYLRRTRKDIGRELPPLTIIPVDLETGDETGALENARQAATDLARRILSHDTAPTERFQLAGELDSRLRKATGLAKAGPVLSYVRMLLESEPQLVLVGWHHAVYDVWIKGFAAAGIPVARYTGEETAREKDAAVSAFVEGKARVLILSLRSGAGLDGLQFTDCAHMVFGELDWSPKVHSQCLGRLDRDGQVKPTFGHYLVAQFGTDPIVVDVLGVKRQQALGIEDPTATELQPVNDRGRAEQLARRYLESIGEQEPEANRPPEASPDAPVTAR